MKKRTTHHSPILYVCTHITPFSIHVGCAFNGRVLPLLPYPLNDTELIPQKAAHLKSTYIQQIKELHSLQTVGAISNEDFIKQRDILLAQMSNVTRTAIKIIHYTLYKIIIMPLFILVNVTSMFDVIKTILLGNRGKCRCHNYSWASCALINCLIVP